MEALMTMLQDLHPEVDFVREDKLIDCGILDSFDVVTLVALIRETWNVAVGARELTAENFNSAQSLWAMICRLREN